MRTATLVATVSVAVAALIATDAAFAATCREELNDFERLLSESSLAIEQPDTFAELAREAQQASELRDEQRCLQKVAELKAALATANPGPEPVSEALPEASTEATEATEVAPPAAPILLKAAPVAYPAESPVDPEGERPDNDGSAD